MQILLMGTGAADGIPGMFADNEVSRFARLHGGKDVRGRSTAFLESGIQIDLPPDIYAQMNRSGLSGLDWNALAFTHGHDDHAALAEIQYALYPFVPDEFPGFTIYANKEIAARIWEMYPAWPLEVVVMSAYEPIVHIETKITPIMAHHKDDEDSFNLIFEEGGRKLLYATDTGFYQPETLEFLHGQGLNALVIECTEGFFRTGYHGHMDIAECVQLVELLRSMGALASDSQVVTTHHSHDGGATHAQLEAALRPHGIEPGYDGMRLTV